MNHLKEQGETYFVHMYHAMQISWFLFTLSMRCFAHSIFPEIFQTAVSDNLSKLEALVKRK